MITFYFSGTGNSQYIAQRFGVKMSISCYSIEKNRCFHDLLIQHN